jgi:hypothetical protein
MSDGVEHLCHPRDVLEGKVGINRGGIRLLIISQPSITALLMDNSWFSYI